MLYNDSKGLIEILKRENLYTEKNLGQNFLINPEILKKIIEAADLKETDYVIEVGPGLGILTLELAEKVKHVRTIELDPKLIPYLEKIFSKYKNIEFEKGNALKAVMPEATYKVVANIPYYITSPLLKHFLRAARKPNLIVLLVQKEVAEKICAKQGDHNILSLSTQIFGTPSIVGHVSKNNFLPAPKVDSAILKIEVYSEPLIKNTKTFFKLIHAAFSQKRKTLLNSLQQIIPKDDLIKILEKSGISLLERPQKLSIEDWKNIISGITNPYN